MILKAWQTIYQHTWQQSTFLYVNLRSAAVSDIASVTEDRIFNLDNIRTVLENVPSHWLAFEVSFWPADDCENWTALLRRRCAYNFLLICIFWEVFDGRHSFSLLFKTVSCEGCRHIHVKFFCCGNHDLAGKFRAKVASSLARGHCVICVTSTENWRQCEGNHAIVVQTSFEIPVGELSWRFSCL